MCNAWNHSSNCTCGFGGDGYSGAGNTQSSWGALGRAHSPTFGTAAYYASVQSYVNPNAKCPVCGAEVFFYRSPYDGRVFFDELGPPWPKHPCTDNNSIWNEQKLQIKGETRSHDRWQLEGWTPIFFKQGMINRIKSGTIINIPGQIKIIVNKYIPENCDLLFLNKLTEQII
jgi:hypothetical protein